MYNKDQLLATVRDALIELVIDNVESAGFNAFSMEVQWSSENPDDIHVDMRWGECTLYTDGRDVEWKRDDRYKGDMHTGVPPDLLAGIKSKYEG